jgi:uncharacterized membrane protein YphA (DoxX/SURF4 family)
MKIMKTVIRNTLYGNAVTTFLRVFMGALFLYSGSFKAVDPEAFGRIVAMYRIIPGDLVPYAALFFPYLEITLGALLLAGYRIQSASLLASGMLFVFSIAIGLNVLRKETFDCGCLELQRLGISEAISPSLLLRNAVLILVLVLTFTAKRQMLSLDGRLERKKLREL